MPDQCRLRELAEGVTLSESAKNSGGEGGIRTLGSC